MVKLSYGLFEMGQVQIMVCITSPAEATLISWYLDVLSGNSDD